VKLEIIMATIDDKTAARTDTPPAEMRAERDALRRECDALRAEGEALRAECDGLREAMRSRAVIEQAKGVLMARHGIDADTAFERLRAQSQRRNVRLATLAAAITAAPRPK
jgi:hypothetical protein